MRLREMEQRHLITESKIKSFLNEKDKKIVESFKIKNILDMALSFSSMTRVFSKGSNEKIINHLEESIRNLSCLKSEEEYQKIHREFCEWFMKNIMTAEKVKKTGQIIKTSQFASWGQGAKVLDIGLKVYFYYCRLPTPEVSDKIIPLLNGAIDTKILYHLKKRDDSSKLLKISTLEAIDQAMYELLQKKIREDINEKFNGLIFPVQYDDIMWRLLNRPKTDENFLNFDKIPPEKLVDNNGNRQGRT